MKMLLALAPLLLSACAATEDPVEVARAETRMNQLLAGKSPVGRMSCLPRRNAERQTIIDERTILFRPNAGSSRVYRSDLTPACAGLDRNSTIVRRSISGDICSGEIFEVRDAGTQFPRGSCTFGEFTEYRGARR